MKQPKKRKPDNSRIEVNVIGEYGPQHVEALMRAVARIEVSRMMHATRQEKSNEASTNNVSETTIVQSNLLDRAG